MKKAIFIMMVAGLGLSTIASTNETATEITTQSDDYCAGWEDGYCEGWRDVKGNYAICPIAPICPIPEIGKDGYRGGYNRGFKSGMRAAHR